MAGRQVNGQAGWDDAAGTDQDIMNEAVGWLVLLQSGEATDQDRAALSRWRGRSQAHMAAWARVEGILDVFQKIPPRIGHATLSRLQSSERRRMLRLALSALVVPACGLALGAVPWREWTADYRTDTGERRVIQLADGTRLVLDTASAVDVAFTAGERRLTLLSGEIFVTTGRDPSPTPRPFIVQTAQGALRPLGTRFTVRKDDDAVRAAVFEGAVEIRPAGSNRAFVLRAGERTAFTAEEFGPAMTVENGADLWERGMLLVRDMPLGDLVAELARYHRGVLRCDPSVAGLAVSGAFPVADTKASLDLLEKTLPLRIGKVTPYWITVTAR
ncbi:MAG TPA: FecR domain-containing protein [Candidatus Sulfotelmatobacter sp.]|jgi:transmembrane sensor|nr:FecR domain-containing protein [Candidatus Sulfotelmatobacter sp.]